MNGYDKMRMIGKRDEQKKTHLIIPILNNSNQWPLGERNNTMHHLPFALHFWFWNRQFVLKKTTIKKKQENFGWCECVLILLRRGFCLVVGEAKTFPNFFPLLISVSFISWSSFDLKDYTVVLPFRFYEFSFRKLCQLFR